LQRETWRARSAARNYNEIGGEAGSRRRAADQGGMAPLSYKHFGSKYNEVAKFAPFR